MTPRTFIEEVGLARKVWMEENPCEDGIDHVTPFDRFLYGAPPNAAKMQYPVCDRCGSPHVSADAAARWDHERQEWGVTNVFDEGHSCDDCGDECEIEWIDGNPSEECGRCGSMPGDRDLTCPDCTTLDGEER